MTANDVLAVLSRLNDLSLPFWLDGGWAVDALVGRETRQHDDLDIVVRLEDVDRIVKALTGYHLSTDDRPTRLVLEDGDRQVDLHPVLFEVDGSARQIGAGSDGGDAIFPADDLQARGVIALKEFPSLSPGLLVHFHTGYEPQDKDRHNVALLCEHFAIPLPPAYSNP